MGNQRPLVTEKERDPIADRNCTRRLVQDQMDAFLSEMLSAPPTARINVEERFQKMKEPIITEIREYRRRQAARVKRSPFGEDPAN